MNYIDEIKSLLQTHGGAELARMLNTTERAIMYWIAEKGAKIPRRETVQKIHELFLGAGEQKEISPQESPSYNDKLLDTIAILVKQNDKLAETNRILAEKISTIPVGVQPETQTGVESMLKGLREFVLKLSVGARYKSIEEAESAFYKSVGDFVPKGKVKGIQNG